MIPKAEQIQVADALTKQGYLDVLKEKALSSYDWFSR